MTARHVALVGSGYWGKNLARVLSELGALAAICDSDPELAGPIAEKFDVPLIGSLGDILADEAITAVAVATPAGTHYRVARDALLAGKDVFVEKPIALELSDAEDLARIAAAEGRVLMVGHLLHYHPAFLRMLEAVREGELGRLRYVYSNRLNIGKLRREENVLWSFAPHDISMILALAGERPNRVSAVGHCYLHETIADTTLTHLDFPSGLHGHVFVSWLHPFKEQKLVAVGESGMLVFDDTLGWDDKLLLYRHGIEWKNGVPVANKANAERVVLSEGEPLTAEMSHFLDCVATRRTPRTDAREGIDVLSILHAAQQSMDAGRPASPAAAAEAAAKPAATARSDYFVHPSALVDDGVSVGAGSKIWHFSHVLGGSRLGARCVIGQNVMIGPDVAIGDGCKLQNNVAVYKGVTLEEDVFCGPSMVFTNVLTPRAHVERKDEFLPTLVRRGATIGANATIICGVTLGRYCMIGAGAVVTRDVPDHALVVGNPARRIGWVSESGERLGDDLVCPRSGQRYRETADGTLEACNG
ncbi:Gfo/Idh/MocA family oxidoreductase [Oceanibacterium hippocampi]|uniref:UDP-2-acetamido-3-amino-2, 3-dideoxy-D-glucuronate N-acetyltransferase n=1 Tax=Oceanibacterium hippocampi TaxID=745714 RepID=A0A1Y5RUD8_9PROT|nr:Gfo/Idh/MocA family oxidoreductase [Oceanibacterium hippocampi]SLN22843.1 UDP-2-acetamido-3-amino-2, 3-dideoxy-D-glucuronate N-acetyltransferase [Oceanibacterium hippocampi]